jgi:hypothetical protein
MCQVQWLTPVMVVPWDTNIGNGKIQDRPGKIPDLIQKTAKAKRLGV